MERYVTVKGPTKVVYGDSDSEEVEYEDVVMEGKKKRVKKPKPNRKSVARPDAADEDEYSEDEYSDEYGDDDDFVVVQPANRTQVNLAGVNFLR